MALNMQCYEVSRQLLIILEFSPSFQTVSLHAHAPSLSLPPCQCCKMLPPRQFYRLSHDFRLAHFHYYGRCNQIIFSCIQQHVAVLIEPVRPPFCIRPWSQPP